MSELTYTIIKSKSQYWDYCSELEKLVAARINKKQETEKIELLALLIEKWDNEHNTFQSVDPITLLRSLMDGRDMNATDLADLLCVSKGLISDILNYKKGLSKEMIRNLSNHFKVSQEAFNRPYKLKSGLRARLRV